MSEKSLIKPAILMVVIVVAVIGGWEIYLRNKGIGIAYDDGKELWSDKRAMVYEPADKTTVFIGSSRIKFDLDIDTWQQLTGSHAVQLAIQGSSPVPVLEDLANDKDFKGKLIVDVTEGLFFSTDVGARWDPDARIRYYKDRTPAQKASFVLNHALESRFVFLDKQFLSLNSELDNLQIPDRPGVYKMPPFPLDFSRVTFHRQTKMTPRFLADTNLQRQVTNIWLFTTRQAKMAPGSGDALGNVLQSVKTAVDKIKARGGEVLFVRTPSSGTFWAGEQKGFPRDKYWDRLLATTGCPGIHFTDYPAIAHFVCPEWSHLGPPDAIVFTREFIRILPSSYTHL
jgi:hypothetical protein